ELSDSQGRRLIEQHEIEHLPSAATLTLLQKASPSSFAAGGDLALFADPVFHRLDPRLAASSVSDASPGQDSQEPMEDADVLRSARDLGMARLPRLPYTRQEGEAILKLWSPENGFQAFDFRANRQQLLQLDLSRFRVLHFATHALLHPRYPDLSGVVLSLVDQNGQPQAGFLRAHEIAGLNLNADLVVLSACQTAMGKEVPGEGMIGLPQSFLDAGVPRVVVSLWNVSDPATAHLMHRFYSGMRENNLRPSAALRRAQLSLLEGERWHSPYYWAPFIYLGRHDP
ncbi:MAG TPA: CHAT domain-containing protein, partial [Acidobacteriota bacterium]|nr:CHAT domain-containing protein [Acidobacteriota bacterium]